MNIAIKFFTCLFTGMLHFYPSSFREEFAEEMRVVFAQTVIEAAERGWVPLVVAFVRECRDLPLNLAREYWHLLTKREVLMTAIKKPEWFFYPGWVVLTACSIPVAFAITWLIVSQVEQLVGGSVMINGRSHITEDWLAGYIFVPALGLATGLLQYWLLRRYLPSMGWWVVATSLGWPLAAAIVAFLMILLPDSLDTNANWFVFLMIFFVGGSISFSQWLVLRRAVPHAIWWIPATIAGWMSVRLAAGPSLTGPLDIWYLGILPAILTAVTLALLINRAHSLDPQGYSG